MNVITSRLPSHLAGRRLPGRFARIGVLNLILGAAFIGAGVAAYLTVGTGTSSSNAAVRTATVQRGVVLSTLSATGTLQAATQLSLDFTSSGPIVSVNIKAGQHVKKGQVLGRIDSTSAPPGAPPGRGPRTSQRTRTCRRRSRARRRRSGGRTPSRSRRRASRS